MQAPLDVIEVMNGIVEGVFEQSPDRAPFLADGDSPAPVGRSRSSGAGGEMTSLAVELIDDDVGILLPVGRGTRFDQRVRVEQRS